MSGREFLNEHRKLTIGVIAAVLLLAVIFLLLRQRAELESTALGSTYFSDDDGKTWFTAPADSLPPFDHSGKPAVRAYLFTTDGGKTRFVGYLERFSEGARKALQNSRQGTLVPLNELTAAANDVEVKTPGDSLWIKRTDPAAKKVMSVTAPPGSSGVPTPVQ